MAEVSVASSEFGGEQSIGLCVVGFLPPLDYTTLFCASGVVLPSKLRSYRVREQI